MANNRSASIFLSYHRKDAAELANQLYRDLGGHGFHVWLDTQAIRGGVVWTVDAEQAIEPCDVLLALLTPGSYRSEICRAEQIRALRYGKCVSSLLMEADAEVVPLHLEARQYRDFSRPSRYTREFEELVKDIEARNGVPLKPEFRETVYDTVPPLPKNYIDRSEALQLLRNALITDGSGRNIPLTALEGMGGIGKTVLAQALWRDPVVLADRQGHRIEDWCPPISAARPPKDLRSTVLSRRRRTGADSVSALYLGCKQKLKEAVNDRIGLSRDAPVKRNASRLGDLSRLGMSRCPILAHYPECLRSHTLSTSAEGQQLMNDTTIYQRWRTFSPRLAERHDDATECGSRTKRFCVHDRCVQQRFRQMSASTLLCVRVESHCIIRCRANSQERLHNPLPLFPWLLLAPFAAR